MGTKNFSNANDLITFSRASGGTYLDSDGVLKLASSDIPRIEYDADGNVLGLLVEESRTNLALNSKIGSGGSALSGWNTLGATASAPSSYAPDGSTDGLTVTTTTNTGLNIFRQISGLSIGQTYTASMWLKGVAGQQVYFVAEDVPTGQELVTFTGDWQRVYKTYVATATTQYLACEIYDRTAAAHLPNVTFEVWGAQYELGAFPTSYIPTAGATATRSADVASIPVSAFGYNQSEGTVVVEASMADPSVNPYQRHSLTINDGTGNNQIRFYNYNSNSSSFVVTDSATTQAALISGVTDSSSVAAGASFKQNNFAASFNGGSASTDSAGNLPSGLTVMLIGSAQGGGNSFLGGHIKSIKYFPRKLTAAQLQELTS